MATHRPPAAFTIKLQSKPMARYNLFKGKSRGSIGDVTFTTQNGIQISRVRNRHPRNPRTNQQMMQRAIWATIVRAYSAGKSFYSTDFESATTPRQNMTAFMSVNMDYLRQLIIDEIDNQTPVDQQRGRVVHPQSYTPAPLDGLTISQGTLTDTIFTVTPATDDTPLTVSMPAPASDTETVADYAQRIGLTSDTIYTIVANIVDTQISILYPQPLATPYAINYQSYFGTVQLTLKTTLPSMPITSATMADIFNIQYTGNVFPYSFAAIAFGNGTWTASILLRKSNQMGTLGISAYQSSTQQTTTSTMHWISTYNAYGIATEYLFTIWGKEEQQKEDTFIPQEPLPYDSEIEYIESTGLQWIDTEYTNNIEYLEIIFSLSVDATINVLCQKYDQYAWRDLTIIRERNNLKASLQTLYDGTMNENKYKIIATNNVYTLYNENNNQIGRCINSLEQTTESFMLLKAGPQRGYYKIYGVRINTDMNLIPVRIGEEGMLYDTIGKKLYKNSGTGKFELGPDKI